MELCSRECVVTTRSVSGAKTLELKQKKRCCTLLVARVFPLHKSKKQRGARLATMSGASTGGGRWYRDEATATCRRGKKERRLSFFFYFFVFFFLPLCRSRLDIRSQQDRGIAETLLATCALSSAVPCVPACLPAKRVCMCVCAHRQPAGGR